MSDSFDPYLKWLAIPPQEQPPNHYRLLALPLYIDDPDVIENAADQRMGHVRKFQAGPHRDASQQILNEIAAAKLCLLNGEKKAAYDEQLRAEQAPRPSAVPTPAAPAAPETRAAPATPAAPAAPAMPAAPAAQASAPPVAAPVVQAPPGPTAAPPQADRQPAFRPLSTAPKMARRPRSSPALLVLGFAVAALVVGVVVILALLRGRHSPRSAGGGSPAQTNGAPQSPQPVGSTPTAPVGAGQAAPLPDGRDLLPLSDLARHVVAGRWRATGDELIAEPSSMARATLDSGSRLNYEVLVEFTRTEGDDAVGLLLPLGSSYAMLQLSSSGGRYSGLSLLSGRRPSDAANPTSREGELENGHRYDLLVRVTGLHDGRVAVAATLDGRPYLSWQGPPSELKEDPFWRVPKRTLALGAHNARVVFHRVKVRDIQQQAEQLVAQLRATLTGHEGAVWSLAFAPSGHVLASASGDGTLRLWDTAAAEPLRTLEGHTDQLCSVAFGPQGRLLASAGVDGTVRLWSVDGDAVATLQNDGGAVNSVAYAPDGSRVASGGVDGKLILWDAAAPHDRQTIDAHEQAISCVSFAPQGGLLATGGSERTIKLWRADTGELVRTLPGHPRGAYTLAFSPDGGTLASAGFEAEIWLWDVATGEQRQVLAGHQNLVRCVAWSPDGRLLASAGRDNTVRIWDAAAGAESATITDAAEVRCVAFSPDGHTLAAAGGDQKIKLWDIRPAKP